MSNLSKSRKSTSDVQYVCGCTCVWMEVRKKDKDFVIQLFFCF